MPARGTEWQIDLQVGSFPAEGPWARALTFWSSVWPSEPGQGGGAWSARPSKHGGSLILTGAGSVPPAGHVYVLGGASPERHGNLQSVGRESHREDRPMGVGPSL